VPVTSQIFAIEQASGEYILQMDVDVMIGLKDVSFDYLEGMIKTLLSYNNAVSHGFQIYQPDSLRFQPIIGADGQTAPDVRCSLIAKSRLLESLPIQNHCEASGWELSWYRALEKHQKKNSLSSLRGGYTDAFYLHIQNYRKTNRWVWHTIQQGVKHGLLPPEQQGKPEVTGNIFSWCLPKRSEELIILLYVKTIEKSSFERSLYSILSQDITSYGLVIVNNTGEEDFTQEYRKCNISGLERATFIDFEHQVASNEAIYKSIHYYLDNAESFVMLMQQGDLFLYPELLSECINRLQVYGADVMIGKEISEDSLSGVGLSHSNFLNPRHEPWQLNNGLAVFRKYLFDNLSHLDLKIKATDSPVHLPGYSKIGASYRWLDDDGHVSILVPIVELSTNPIRFDHFNVLRTRALDQEKLRTAVDYVRTQSAKKEGLVELGRKTFLPNTDKIELDITYDCHLKCFHCNRSCTQAPTNAHMSLQQVQDFVHDSVTLGKRWQLINVLGGEPTLHPQFETIVQCLLHDYIIPHSPQTTLQITSNGHGEMVQRKLAALPRHPNLIVNDNSFKDDREVPYFTPFNLAPVDEPNASSHEYHKGCWVTSYCGIGLNHMGYFACGVAGGIERLLKSGNSITRLTNLNEHLLREQLSTYCRLCGNFTAYAQNRGDFMERAEKDSAPPKAMSESWKKIYKAHNEG
jgi:uncharacterized radical SAM superfamily Fe-S cluster-containing enzyme